MKSERDFGRAYAEFIHQDTGNTAPVDIDKMLGQSADIPSDDYRAMVAAGIENPNAREYWRGYNSACESVE